MAEGLNIGITFHWEITWKDIWKNKVAQNVYFLSKVLEKQPNVESVYFVYSDQDPLQTRYAEWLKGMKLDLRPLSDVIETTDLMIEGLWQITPELEGLLRAHHSKVVQYQTRQTYVTDTEKFINNRMDMGSFIGTKFDAIWLLPQFMKTSHDYIEIVSRSRVYEAPLLWDETFMDAALDPNNQLLVAQQSMTYQKYQPSGKKEKRITAIGANLSVTETVIFPALAAEEAYNEEPSVFDHVYLINSYTRKDVESFHHFTGYMKLLADKKLTTEGRFDTLEFICTYTDLILGFHWADSLNYYYLDALYVGLPIVHNSPILKAGNVGYYYPSFDAYEAAHQIIRAAKYYDDELAAQEKKNKKFLHKLSPALRANVRAYGKLLQEVMNKDK